MIFLQTTAESGQSGAFDWVDGLNIALACVSIALAVLAAVLSIMFYKWSARDLEHSSEIMKEVRADVDRQDAMFREFFDRYFSLIEGYVVDSRNWVTQSLIPPDAESVEARRSALSDAVRESLLDELAPLLKGAPPESAQSTQELIGRTADRVVDESIQSQAFDIRQRVLEIVTDLRSRGRTARPLDVFENAAGLATWAVIMRAIEDLVESGDLQSAEESIGDRTPLWPRRSRGQMSG